MNTCSNSMYKIKYELDRWGNLWIANESFLQIQTVMKVTLIAPSSHLLFYESDPFIYKGMKLILHIFRHKTGAFINNDNFPWRFILISISPAEEMQRSESLNRDYLSEVEKLFIPFNNCHELKLIF